MKNKKEGMVVVGEEEEEEVNDVRKAKINRNIRYRIEIRKFVEKYGNVKYTPSAMRMFNKNGIKFSEKNNVIGEEDIEFKEEELLK